MGLLDYLWGNTIPAPLAEMMKKNPSYAEGEVPPYAKRNFAIGNQLLQMENQANANITPRDKQLNYEMGIKRLLDSMNEPKDERAMGDYGNVNVPQPPLNQPVPLLDMLAHRLAKPINYDPNNYDQNNMTTPGLWDWINQ